MRSRRWLPVLSAVAAVLAVTACSGSARHHGDDPNLIPAGGSGAAALGQPFASLDELADWVQWATDECDNVEAASREDLAAYLGPTRYAWYEPFVAEWATCSVRPYDRIGLVRFVPDGQADFQRFWRDAMREGAIADNPDWAFGNGFAITAGPLGTEELGLRYLWCTPDEPPEADTVEADVDGCVFASWGHHA